MRSVWRGAMGVARYGAVQASTFFYGARATRLSGNKQLCNNFIPGILPLPTLPSLHTYPHSHHLRLLPLSLSHSPLIAVSSPPPLFPFCCLAFLHSARRKATIPVKLMSRCLNGVLAKCALVR